MVKNASDRWAVLIGINGYHESLGRLKYSVNDCRRLAEVLTTGDDAFPADHVLVLTDDEAAERRPTYGNIHSWLASWLSQPDEDDTVLVFFAGHGREMDGKCYLVPADATLQTIHVAGIPVPYVQELLNRCKARQKVLVLDACHSGAGRDVSTMAAPMMKTLSAGKGIYTLTSCDVDELSHEWDEKKQGVFSYYLAEALSGSCPPDGRGHITADGVYEWVFDRVREWTRTHRCSQAPKRVCDVSGAVVLRRSEPDWRRLAADLQSQLADARREMERFKHREPHQERTTSAFSTSDTEDAASVLNEWASRRVLTVRPLVDGKRRSIINVTRDEYVRVNVQFIRETRKHWLESRPGPPEPGEEPVPKEGVFDPWAFGDNRCPDGWGFGGRLITCIPAVATGTCSKCQGKKNGCLECKNSGIQTKYHIIDVDWMPEKLTRLWRRSSLGAHVDARIPPKATGVVLLDETRIGADEPDVSALPLEIGTQVSQLIQQVLRGVNGKVRKVRCAVETIAVERVTMACGSGRVHAEIWGTNRRVVMRSRPPKSLVRVIVACVIGATLLAAGVAMAAIASGIRLWQ